MSKPAVQRSLCRRSSAWALALLCAVACRDPSLAAGDDPVAASRTPAAADATQRTDAAPGGSLLHDEGEIRVALAALSDPLPRPIRALSLRIHPDRALLQVQDKRRPFAVQQYRYKAGDIMGPVAVRLAGTGKLKDNLFPLKYADLNVIAPLVREAEQRVDLEGARATSVLLKRNLPASMDIQFEVLIVSDDGSRRYVDARKDGKIFRVRAP